ncbi:MAG: bifunctional alpha/beta hydrolase/OsmC family protein [Pseudomonadota bacterium]
MRTEKLTFPGADGASLAARLDLPEGRPRAYALWAHCFTCTKDIFAASRVAAGLVAHDFGVLRFDFTGLGASEGEFANTNFSSNVGDLVAATAYMRARLEAPKLLIGHSLGGAAVLAAAGQVPEAVAVATIAAPADPAHVARHFKDARPEIDAKGEAEVLLAGRPFRIKKQFLDDIESQKLAAAIGALRKALLIFHSPLDAIVSIDNAGQIFQAAKHPKSFVSLDGADHLLSRREDAIYVADIIAAWAARYVGEPQADTVGAETAGPADGVLVAEVGEGKFAQVATVGRHRLRADEPVSVGGNDSGPGPYDYLLVGLGACTSMTVRMYAERKNWPVEKISVSLAHRKIHAEDCATCETKEGKIDRIERELEITGPLDAEQRAKLVEIAEKCPVHRTLHSENLILTRLKE